VNVGSSQLAVLMAGAISLGFRTPVPTKQLPDLRDPSHLATVGLRAVLAAYGIRVDADELDRECRATSSEGASIDDLESAAGQHGLHVEQVMVPPEHLLIRSAGALPAIVIASDNRGDFQFIVVWRVDDDSVQILDPSTGRRRVRASELVRSLFIHEQPIAAAQWADFVRGEGFRAPLAQRLRALGLAADAAAALVAEAAGAAADGSGIAALDAVVRTVESVGWDGKGARTSPQDLLGTLRRALACARGGACTGTSKPAPLKWTGRPGPAADDGTPQILVRAAVILGIKGRKK
jgi:hypothetical protein